MAQTTSTNAVATSQSMLTSRQMDSHMGTQNNTTINNVIATALAQLFQCNQAGSTNQIGQFSLYPSSPLLNLHTQHSSSSPVVALLKSSFLHQQLKYVQVVGRVTHELLMERAAFLLPMIYAWFTKNNICITT